MGFGLYTRIIWASGIGCFNWVQREGFETICIEVTHIVQSDAISARNG